MIMKGKWVGEFTYGNTYPEKRIGKSVSFEMNLTANGTEFEVNFSDEETRSIFQKESTVVGFVEGNYIFFEMQYPKRYEIDDDGNINVLENVSHPVIKHEGYLSDNKFVGTWEMHQYYEENETIFSELLGAGTWCMQKDIAGS
jgi:hypothetical protein